MLLHRKVRSNCGCCESRKASRGRLHQRQANNCWLMLGLVWLKYLQRHLFSEMTENKIKERQSLSMWSGRGRVVKASD